MNMRSTIQRPPILQTDGDVVEEPARWPCDRLERPSNNNEKVEEEGADVFVVWCSSSQPSFPASKVKCVTFL
jgi:hypothetical protein